MRAGTISHDDFGDSVLNSVADIGCCALGYVLARRLRTSASVALVIAIEVGLLIAIRDDLTLNVVMLLVPLDGVKAWQGGG